MRLFYNNKKQILKQVQHDAREKQILKQVQHDGDSSG